MLDLDAETAILRRRSRFGSLSIAITLFLGFGFALVSIGVGVGERAPDDHTPRWILFAIAGGTILLTGFIVFIFSIKRNALIERGIIINAVPGSAVRIYSSIYRIIATYDVDGITYNRPLYLDLATCTAIERTRCVMVVVLPYSPQTMSPLHSFVGLKDKAAVSSGAQGLSG